VKQKILESSKSRVRCVLCTTTPAEFALKLGASVFPENLTKQLGLFV
jgi:hypothetical protein